MNGQVAERERASRLREIYDHIDSKSFTFYNGHKFRKSELYARNRKLKLGSFFSLSFLFRSECIIQTFCHACRFEGIGTLVPRSGKVTDITVIVLSDVLIFLQEASNGKLHFYSQDNRVSTLSACTLGIECQWNVCQCQLGCCGTERGDDPAQDVGERESWSR